MRERVDIAAAALSHQHILHVCAFRARRSSGRISGKATWRDSAKKNVQARCVFLESKKLGKCLIKGGRKAKHLLLAVIQGECHHLNDCTGLYSSRCRRRPSRFVLI